MVVALSSSVLCRNSRQSYLKSCSNRQWEPPHAVCCVVILGFPLEQHTVPLADSHIKEYKNFSTRTPNSFAKNICPPSWRRTSSEIAIINWSNRIRTDSIRYFIIVIFLFLFSCFQYLNCSSVHLQSCALRHRFANKRRAMA